MNLTMEIIREVWPYIPKKTKRKLLPFYRNAYVAKMKILNPQLMKRKTEIAMGLPPNKLDQKTRKMETVRSRQSLYYILRHSTELSLDGIGRLFNHGSDHANVLHGIKKVNNAIEGFDPELLDVFNKVAEAVGYQE